MSSNRKNKVVSTAWTYSDCTQHKLKNNTQEGKEGETEMNNEININKPDLQNIVLPNDGNTGESTSSFNERQPPDGGNEKVDENSHQGNIHTTRFSVTPCDYSNNGEMMLRRAVSDHDIDIDVDIEIEVDLRDLGTDIRKIIASMENLQSEIGDLECEEKCAENTHGVDMDKPVTQRKESLKVDENMLHGRLRRKKSREFEDINRWSDPARQISQNSSVASRKNKGGINTPFGILRKSNLSARRGYSSDENILKNRQILNVTSLVNENFDESRVFKTSASCVDLGTARSVGRNVDMSNKKTIPTPQYRPPKPNPPSPRYGGFSAIELYPPREKWRIFKNLITISLAFMIMYTAYNSTHYLKKYFDTSHEPRSWYFVAECSACMVTAITLPTLVIKWLGCKWAMVVALLLCIPYFITQFVGENVSMLCTSAILGVGMSILWAALGTYLTVMAEAYTVITDVDKDTVLMHFFGIFYFVFYSYIVWSSLAASEVLTHGLYDVKVAPGNYSVCGVNFCPKNMVVDELTDNRTQNEEFVVWGILLALAVVSPIMIGIAVDTLSRYNEGNRLDKTKKETQCELLSGSLAQFINRSQLYLAPFIMLLSISDKILATDFSIGYFSCVYGAPHFRDIIICYGVFLLVFCLLVGSCAVRLLGRIAVIVGSLCMFLTVMAVLKFWDPEGHKTAVFFIISAIWAVPQASIVVISAMQGVLFVGKEEAAYSTLVFWRFTGQLILYVIQPYVCMNAILLVEFVLLLLAIAGYVTFELTWKGAPYAMDHQRALSIASSDGMVEIPLGNPSKGQFQF